MFRNILQRSNHNIRRFSTSPLKQKSLITDFHHIKLFTGSANATKELFMNKFNFKLFINQWKYENYYHSSSW